MTAIERGRAVYNFRCYFCHGYNGNAKTVAATYLNPPPLDFTSTGSLTAKRIIRTLKDGRAGTAMKSFKGILDGDDMVNVAAFIMDQFVYRQSINTYYHTAENGWPEHRKKYGGAYPFVLGDISPDIKEEKLKRGQRQGLRLFRSSCISCHETGKAEGQEKIWEKFPLSHQGCGVRCHADGTVEFPWSETPDQNNLSTAGRALSPYDKHNRAPRIEDLSPLESRGKTLFEKNCAFCHAMDGTGGNWIGSFLQPHPRDLTNSSVAKRLTGKTLTKAIKEGLPGTSMSAWQFVLNEKQIAAIVAYVEKAFFKRRR